ncbi:DNRLRE domain-containing protein [Streptomyces sp. NPDC001410]|uniref:DNRLRE domain-containing protein n=1 Tax=Streptomyces sp. NPDC001410 TaxID=3364574 RepID=UPI00369C110F
MTPNWRRRPGGRTGAVLLASALAATGIVYAGLRLDSGTAPADSHHRPHAGAVTESAALTQAARTGKNVEVTAARTASSTTWARPDGLMQKRLYSSPIRAKVGGEWKAIDPGLHRTKAGWEPKATNTRVVFSAGSGSRATGQQHADRSTVRRVSLLKGEAADSGTPLVTLHVGDHDIQLTWPGPVPSPIIDGNRALYPDIFPGGDLVLTADDDGFAQLVVLKNREAASDPHAQQLAYGLHSADLTFRLNPVTGIVSAEDESGDEVAVSPTPLMWDSSGTPAVTDGTVGASVQPTEPETPDPVDTSSPMPSDSPTADDTAEPDEQSNTDVETLSPASDGPEPSISESPLPPAPAEPTPDPTQTGSAATLSLPLLDGPSPDSRGSLVDADLSAGNWTLTPDQDFLTDPDTTFPVFIDPSVKKHILHWTTAYNRFPKATFYDGKGFNKGGSHEARVGFESDTWGTSRSYFNINFDPDLKGTKITRAKLRMLETYAWSCSERSMSVHLTGEVNAHTNWSNAPKLHDGNKLATKSFAHGWKASSCHDAYEAFDVKDGAQDAADDGDDTITFGLRARDEHSQYAWKKFQADLDNAPVLELVYNRKPAIVSNSLDLGPDGKCTTTTPYVRMGSDDLTFTAKATDKDKNLDYFDFDLWQTGQWDTTGDLLKSTGKVSAGGDTDSALRTTPKFSTSGLKSGATYSWRVRALDDAGSTSSWYPKTPCRFVLDTTAPRPPKVSSTDFPNADGSENGFGNDAEDANWSAKKFGTPGSFTVRALNTDVVRYEYGFNSAYYTGSLARVSGTATTVSATMSGAKPPTAGPNVLYVRAVDSAGNVSEPTKYFFYVAPRDQGDTPGDFTGDKLPDMMVVTEGGNLSLYPSQSTSDLSKGSGDLDYSMRGAYRANPEKDPNGDDLAPYVSAPSGHFKDALITHNGDLYGGDGLQDLVVRVEGKLWVYPGDGYGAVNVDRRREILLPAGAPSPSAMTQIVAAGDATGDGRTDFFATVRNSAGTDDELWALIGYHGATVDQAIRLSASAWKDRDLVTVLDVSGDGVTDIIYRTDVSSRLMLRKGIAASTGGGTDLNSLAAGANSAGGMDTEYGANGWSSTSIPLLMGTPDANGDSVPDIWAVKSDGSVRFYAGSKTVLLGSGTEIIGPASYWKTRLAIG